MKRILIGSPIHQNAEILKEFLISLRELNKDGLEVDYCFVDDNSDEKSKEILVNFKKSMDSEVRIIDSKYNSMYYVDDYTHRWSHNLVKKVTDLKNNIIKIAIENEYDYLFFIDSDIVLHPNTLNRLISTNKEIIANIFWTKWNPNIDELPQVWLKDEYTLYDSSSNSNITKAEVEQQTTEFIEMLRKPGTYKVGGLGACTLISRSALIKGVNFDPVYNISFWGEDRHFCIRAAVLGVQLWVDTYYPAYHIYRKENLDGVEAYKDNYEKRDKEMLTSKLLDKIIKGVQGANTYSYKEEFNKEFLKYYSEAEGKRILDILEENKKFIVENKIINRLQVMEWEITFYNNNSLAVASVKYNENGYKNDYSYYKEFIGKCTLMPVDGEWVITEWVVEKNNIPESIQLVRKAKEENNKLTLSMVVKDEGNRYLRRMLESARDYIDNAVIINDGSTDNTVEIINDVLKDIPFTIIENKESKFNNEVILRKQQWLETIATNPDWIIFLDADEIFEDKFKNEVKAIMKNIEIDGYMFRLFDFWDTDNYRNDHLWYAHYTYRLFMIRYQKNFKYEFIEAAQHCGRMPANCMQLAYERSDMKLKHYGWAKIEDRMEKYERYMRLDPDGKFGNINQYKSILDANPTISRWNENE